MLSNLVYAATSILPASGQSVKFDWISIAYIVILVIAIIVGIKKGFISSLLTLFGTVIAGVVAYYACRPLAVWIANSTGWGTSVSNSIYNWIIEKAPDAANAVTNDLLTTEVGGTTALATMLNEIGIPTFLQTYVTDFITTANQGVEAVGLYIANAVTEYVFVGGAFLVIFLVISIIVAILKHVTKNINKTKVIGPINKILGAVMGLVIGCIVVIVVSFGLSSLSGIEQLNTFLNEQLYLMDDTTWTLGKMLYTNNFLSQLLGYIK